MAKTSHVPRFFRAANVLTTTLLRAGFAAGRTRPRHRELPNVPTHSAWTQKWAATYSPTSDY